MDYLFTFSIICSGSGRSCWLLRGLYLSSSLYTFQECILGLARGRHFSLPRIHPQFALKFLSRGDSVSVDPLRLPISPIPRCLFQSLYSIRFSPGCQVLLVPLTGFEPARLSTMDFESTASTYYTTGAKNFLLNLENLRAFSI